MTRAFNGTRRLAGLLPIAVGLLLAVSGAARAETREEIALSLAEMLRAARSVISENQPLINDPSIGFKGITGTVVLQKAKQRYIDVAKRDPARLDPRSLHGRLMKALMASIVEVMETNQPLINEPGVEFKAFLPAVFARLVSERFRAKVGSIALISVTAPNNLVRNRSARPDPWESSTIERVLLDPTHPKGQHVATRADKRGRSAFRMLIPEYYSQSCLYCHGVPKGEPDVTGYAKEGGSVGQLGGVISVTIFEPAKRPVVQQTAVNPEPWP
jgi:hypothetical protein